MICPSCLAMTPSGIGTVQTAEGLRRLHENACNRGRGSSHRRSPLISARAPRAASVPPPWRRGHARRQRAPPGRPAGHAQDRPCLALDPFRRGYARHGRRKEQLLVQQGLERRKATGSGRRADIRSRQAARRGCRAPRVIARAMAGLSNGPIAPALSLQPGIVAPLTSTGRRRPPALQPRAPTRASAPGPLRRNRRPVRQRRIPDEAEPHRDSPP